MNRRADELLVAHLVINREGINEKKASGCKEKLREKGDRDRERKAGGRWTEDGDEGTGSLR
jgi:hypothetical protein